MDAAPGGVRLTVPLAIGSLGASEIAIEPGHCERLFRMAACVAIREGRLDPQKPVTARLVPGRIRGRHDVVSCLETCAVELRNGRGRVCARVEFPRAAFAAFAALRALHLLANVEVPGGTHALSYSLHAAPGDEDPFPVALPAFAPVSIADLTASAIRCGEPPDDWIITVVTPAVAAGLEEIAGQSRAQGIEVAGRIHTRVGFDRARRCFVRVLERLVISRATQATALAVVSTAASWSDFLTDGPTNGSHALASVHTHVHLDETGEGGDGAPGDHLLAEPRSLAAAGRPCISIDDIVTHYTTFPDALSAALIVSVFPDRCVVSLYGYTPRALVREEGGYWLLVGDGARSAATKGET